MSSLMSSGASIEVWRVSDWLTRGKSSNSRAPAKDWSGERIYRRIRKADKGRRDIIRSISPVDIILLLK
jgi:hypothetical protein